MEDVAVSAVAQKVGGGVEAVGDQKIAALWEELQTDDGRTYVEWRPYSECARWSPSSWRSC